MIYYSTKNFQAELGSFLEQIDFHLGHIAPCPTVSHQLLLQLLHLYFLG